MKIIYLNCWHAGVKDELYNFLLKESSDTDIFGLLEVNEEMSNDFFRLFPNYQKFFIKNSERSGQEILVKDGIKTSEYEEIQIREQEAGDTGCLQKLIIDINSKKIQIGSLQGRAYPGTKYDTPVRLKQSEIILNSLSLNSPAIIGGDFNLLPETKSIKMFEEAGYRNLIKEFDIKSTRNKIAWETLKNDEGFVKQYFADYCFTTPDIKVKSFKVPDIEISDHLPQILEFDLPAGRQGYNH